MELASMLERARPVERVAYGVGGLLIAAGLFHFVVYLVDGGPWEGPVFLIFGLGSGIAMIAKGTVLYRTVSPEVAYDTAGPLKPVHAVGLHAILVLPLIAELTRRRGWPEPRRHRAVVIATGVYVVATLVAVALSLA